MSHITGVITGLFDNRINNGQASKFPNYKIMIGDNEFTAWTANELPCKKGDNVSLHFGVSKKTGKPFVQSDFETKELKIQVIPKSSGQPISQEIPIDDNLSDYEPDDFASNGVIDNSGTNFDPNYLEKELTNPQTLKEQQIFCTAILKSSIEGKFLEPSKDNIDKMILMLKDIYKRNFIK